MKYSQRELNLNPFRAGQGLSTDPETMDVVSFNISIPLEQGRVFRPAIVEQEEDEFLISIPLEQGRVFRQIPMRQ